MNRVVNNKEFKEAVCRRMHEAAKEQLGALQEMGPGPNEETSVTYGKLTALLTSRLFCQHERIGYEYKWQCLDCGAETHING